MISKALTLLVRELNDYINTVDIDSANRPDVVELGNIALAENSGNTNNGAMEKLVLSLVNIEEEKRLKNSPTYIKNGNQTEYINPPINLNLYLLFSSSFDNYTTALRRLSQVIEFFQGKYVFTLANSPNSGFSNDAQVAGMKLILDIHTLNFEQINDLWGSLGSKQVPFVMYRTRLVMIRRDSLSATSPSIEEVSGIAN
ncbi:MAG: DUF4255 domain-containing protein [Bacteroidia bacterium]|nr:DUF4255 domain-containing protein [Bacteroidia bacterium]